MKTAVVGLGTIGATVASQLVAGGVAIEIAERDLAKAQALAQRLGPRATAVPVAQALQGGDVIVLAVGFDAVRQLLADHRAALTGKILVDPTNPIEPDGKGGFRKTIPDAESSGMAIARLLPEGSELVKAFGTLSGATLASAAGRAPAKAVLFYAADAPEAAVAVEALIRACGFDPVSVGGIDQSLRIEVFGDLHEMGGLGRVVTAPQAQALLSRAA